MAPIPRLAAGTYGHGVACAGERTGVAALSAVRVLHVEPDAFAAALVGALLDEEGAEVVWARDADVAAGAARGEPFDVVLAAVDARTLPTLAGRLEPVAPGVPIVSVASACSGRELIAGIRDVLEPAGSP